MGVLQGHLLVQHPASEELEERVVPEQAVAPVKQEGQEVPEGMEELAVWSMSAVSVDIITQAL